MHHVEYWEQRKRDVGLLLYLKQFLFVIPRDGDRARGGLPLGGEKMNHEAIACDPIDH